ncbi:MAG: hypothetical protein M0Q91_05230 [Methanoregula sp.]|jgi:hypothetical protein|nr:hypothetical protein [Methanoregula sp.]
MMDKTTAQFKRGMKEEAKEHPGFNVKQVGQIVSDHLKIHPAMYRR